MELLSVCLVKHTFLDITVHRTVSKVNNNLFEHNIDSFRIWWIGLTYQKTLGRWVWRDTQQTAEFTGDIGLYEMVEC